MEEPPSATAAEPSTTVLRKRTRGRTQTTENPERTSAGSDQEERESSPDDFKEARPRAKRGRPAAAAAAAPGPSAAAPQKLAGLTLIEVIKGNGKLIPQAVKLWVERYEKDPKPAMVELLMMLFEACGAKYQFKGELLDEIDVDDVVVALVELARSGNVEDYQSSKKKDFKNFKENLQSFWDNLVRECQHGPLVDQILFEKCMDYIIALSCTPPRVYRQAATLTGLQLVTSFISVANTLGTQRETTRRQLDAEKKKQTEGPRVESLNKRFSTTHDKITILEQMMRKIFQGLFVHRYRDIDPNIRMSCIESLGVWILSYPSLFLQDLYLKYLGWTLNDKSAGVRKASVHALQNLYEVDDNVPTLGLFTERFSSRMIDLADDIDISVAVCAIGLVKQLLRHQLLQDDDLIPLYDLLIDNLPEIRHAIGALVYEHLISQKFNSSQSGAKGDGSNSSEVHLGRMLKILNEFSADPILSIYVIDDVWEYMKAMKDWKCIISMLLDENPLIELTDEDATNLVRLLCSSVKKAVGERIVPATDNRKLHYSKAQKEVFEHNRRDITLAMMKNYPLLLRKFMADKTKVPSLIEIIVHMNLELYSLKRQEQNFKTVLQLIKEAFFKHGEREALRSCVNAINLCSTESQGELKDFARNTLKELQDELVAKLKSAMKEVADGGDEYPLLVNLKRLYELQLTRAVSTDTLYEDLVSTLQSHTSKDHEVISFLLLNTSLHLELSLQSIITTETVAEASLYSLLAKHNSLSQQLEYFLNSPPELEGNPANQLACRVCILLSELWFMFRKTLFASTNLERLGYHPDASILEKLWNLCLQQLDETEDEYANREYIVEANREAVIIAAAKLVANDVVSKAYRRYMVELSESDDEESSASKHFQECKELAARISGMFIGAARNKHRSNILKIVSDGIEYAFLDAPKQLSFLEGAVIHFVSKLPTSDILDIVKDVQSRTENVNTDKIPVAGAPITLLWTTCLRNMQRMKVSKMNRIIPPQGVAHGKSVGERDSLMSRVRVKKRI